MFYLNYWLLCVYAFFSFDFESLDCIYCFNSDSMHECNVKFHFFYFVFACCFCVTLRIL